MTEVPRLGNSPAAVACPLEPKPSAAFGASPRASSAWKAAPLPKGLPDRGRLPRAPTRQACAAHAHPACAHHLGGRRRTRAVCVPAPLASLRGTWVPAGRCGGPRDCFPEGLPARQRESWDVSAGLLLPRKNPFCVGSCLHKPPVEETSSLVCAPAQPAPSLRPGGEGPGPSSRGPCSVSDPSTSL